MSEELITTSSYIPPDWDNGVCSATGDVCYHGETSAANLITGNALASLIGLNTGTAINSDAGWINIKYKGKILYIAKKPIRYNVNVVTMYNLGLTKAAGVSCIINGKNYIVRTLNGGAVYAATGKWVINEPHQYGSEWNDIMYRIRGRTGTSVDGIVFGEIAQYSNADLGTTTSTGAGARDTILSVGTSGNAVFRDGGDCTAYSDGSLSGAPNAKGYRPVLQLVS